MPKHSGARYGGRSAVLQQSNYIRGFDGLRALAVLAVVCHHWNLPGFQSGRRGVDVFFGLSGYLITTLILREWESTDGFRLKDFYVRRALRLLPALIALLLVVLVMPWDVWSGSPTLGRWGACGAALFYSANWVRAFGGNLGPLAHIWSLSVEEQFYLLWPPILYVLLKLRTPPIRILIGLLVLVATTALWRVWLCRHGCSVERVYNGLDTRADALMVGCALAIAVAENLLRRCREHQLAIFLLALLALTFLLTGSVADWLGPAFESADYSICAISTATIIAAISVLPNSAGVAFLERRPLVWLGRRSYGLYLWHFPCISLSGFVRKHIHMKGVTTMMLVVGMIFVALSYRFVEQPFLALKSRR